MPKLLTSKVVSGLALLAGGHYLLIQDTTQPNFEKNRSNIRDKSGLGVIADNKSLGFFLHPSLLGDASDKRSLGFIDVQMWSREVTTLSRKKSQQSKNAKIIEEKESWFLESYYGMGRQPLFVGTP